MIFKYLIKNLINKINNYKNKKNNNNSNSSFGLLETAITVAIMGTIAGATLGAYNATNPQVRNDLKKMEKIEEALQQFFTINGRLPFPANPTITIGNDLYLKENPSNVYNAGQEVYACYVGSTFGDGATSYNSCYGDGKTYNKCCIGDFLVWGVVPTETLGLPENYAYDSQGHNFEYITHSVLTYPFGFKWTNNTSANAKKEAYTAISNGKYGVFVKADGETTTAGTHYASTIIPLRRLEIYNADNSSLIPATQENTAYVLISKGKTNQCYFDAKHNVVETTNPTDKTLNNCVQNYASAVSSVVTNSGNTRTIYKGYDRGVFENLVKYKTLTEIVGVALNNKQDIDDFTSITHYQSLNDENLTTDGKNVIDAINELKDRIDKLKNGIDACSEDAINNGLYIAQNTINKINNNKKSKNIALWAPGIYKFSNNDCVANNYDGQLPENRAGVFIIRDILSTTALDVTMANWTYRMYTFIDYKTGLHYFSVHKEENRAWSNDLRLIWGIENDNCETNWPVGSIYISTSLGTADDVKKKLGCGAWQMVEANKTLWTISSGSGGGTTTPCLPNVKGSFSINDGAYFTGDGGLFTTSSATSGYKDANDGGVSSYKDKIQLSMSSATGGIWNTNCAGVVRPPAFAVYMWKRTA
ncbi:MAG: hypothetical protein IJT15_01785 [Rickettsiales bacterium]|nr:hypothetical protein [Rickettsiales bacterium]